MLYGCLFDILRLILLGFALVCVLIFGATLWLGPNFETFVPLTVTPDIQYDITVRGPTPDLDVTVVRHVLFRETFQHIVSVQVHALPLAFATILLCAVTWALDWFGWQRHARP